MVEVNVALDPLNDLIMRTPVVGRRKASVVRVHFKKGSGKVSVNGRDFAEYFKAERNRKSTLFPLDLASSADQRFAGVDVYCVAVGGGTTGQAEAMRLAIARKIIELSEALRLTMRSRGLLTCDSRKVESKKYGLRKARRRFQYAKR